VLSVGSDNDARGAARSAINGNGASWGAVRGGGTAQGAFQGDGNTWGASSIGETMDKGRGGTTTRSKSMRVSRLGGGEEPVRGKTSSSKTT
jgi:hypothetical protein